MSQSKLVDKLLDCYPRWSPTMYKFTLGGLVVCAIAVPLFLVAVPFVEFFNGMAAQPKGKAQMTFGRTHDEALIVERPPVEGTRPRGVTPYPFDELPNTIEAAMQVGEALDNPLPRTIDNMRHGQDLFVRFCMACHGPTGEGDGSVIGPDRFPAPPSLHTAEAVAYTDGALFHIMTKGIGKMPAYEQKLSPHERWLVAHYLRALQRSMAPQPEDLTP